MFANQRLSFLSFGREGLGAKQGFMASIKPRQNRPNSTLASQALRKITGNSRHHTTGFVGPASPNVASIRHESINTKDSPLTKTSSEKETSARETTKHATSILDKLPRGIWQRQVSNHSHRKWPTSAIATSSILAVALILLLASNTATFTEIQHPVLVLAWKDPADQKKKLMSVLSAIELEQEEAHDLTKSVGIRETLENKVRELTSQKEKAEKENEKLKKDLKQALSTITRYEDRDFASTRYD